MKVQLTDVTLRDGLQMEKGAISLEQKLGLFRRLSKLPYERLEITSFVNPKWVPQFADSEEFCRALVNEPKGGPEWMAFVPNEKGLERLLPFPIPWVSCFIAVSEAFNKKNVNATVDETLVGVKAIVNRSRHEGRKCRVYISTVFGCPYQGKIPPADVLALVEKVAALNPDEISLGDTIGVAVPTQVVEILSGMKAHFPVEKTAVHFHNTYGLGLAASQTAARLGVMKHDGSTGGIGGCPYAKGATGNTATDELLYSFFRMGLVDKFPLAEITDVLKYLGQDLKLEVHSSLYEILHKGGTIYGV